MANPEHLERLRERLASRSGSRKRRRDTVLDLSGADLSKAKLVFADLDYANLTNAKLIGANLTKSQLNGTRLEGADLTGADLSYASLRFTELRGANLSRAILTGANVDNADLFEANLRKAQIGYSTFIKTDLSEAVGLNEVRHIGPSSIGVDTLLQSKGRIPENFLRGCGFQPWEIQNAKLYDPSLTPHEISELHYKIFDCRTRGPLFIAGVFISYSRKDELFVDAIYERLQEEGASVWLDRHDMLAGDLQKQVGRAIRLNNVVLLALSEASTASDWVENELDMARKKELKEDRDVLCPVALDESWKRKLDDQTSDRVLWRTLTKKNILDFSKWQDTEEFDTQFAKLLRGLRINYEPKK